MIDLLEALRVRLRDPATAAMWSSLRPKRSFAPGITALHEAWAPLRESGRVELGLPIWGSDSLRQGATAPGAALVIHTPDHAVVADPDWLDELARWALAALRGDPLAQQSAQERRLVSRALRHPDLWTHAELLPPARTEGRRVYLSSVAVVADQLPGERWRSLPAPMLVLPPALAPSGTGLAAIVPRPLWPAALTVRWA